MFKKVLSGLVVLGLLVCEVWLVEARSTDHGVKGKTEAKINANPSKSIQSVSEKPKLQTPKTQVKTKEVGTPTVQQLLNKVKANYSKIKDLKANWRSKTRLREGDSVDEYIKKIFKIIGNFLIIDEKFYFKAPNKLKWSSPTEGILIMKNNRAYGKVEDIEGSYRLPWYTLLDPQRFFEFCFRLDEIIEKFDTRVISRPATDTWVIEAVPKASNPKDEYNYPHPKSKLEVFIDYNKGVIIKIDYYGDFTNFHPAVPDGFRLTCQSELQYFQSINNIWIPTKFILTKFPLPKYRPEQITEEYTLSNIQLNTSIPDSEFEF